jgi:divalent metal cation (Fe/Co/Zn/Cd) transporter
MANSIALVGFGLDSLVESLSGFVLIWRLRMRRRIPQAEERVIETRASRFVGITFLILGAYVLFESVKRIVTREMADPSPMGIIIAVISLIVMPLLGYQKYKIGRRLGLRSLVADSKETFVCAGLSLALLLGLGGRFLFDAWWLDPLVGLIIVGYLFKEGWELVFDDECGCHNTDSGESSAS